MERPLNPLPPQTSPAGLTRNFLRTWVVIWSVAGLAGFLMGAFSGCVTVNVNFPESAVQSATDDYVKQLYQQREKSRLNPTPKPSASSTASPAVKAVSWLAARFINEAQADEMLKFDSPRFREIQAQLAAQVDQVIAAKKAGQLGESREGMLVVKTDKPLLSKKLQPLVEKENTLRQQLYTDALTTRGLQNYRISDIREHFARSFQAQSPAGTWIQSADGAWSRK